MIYNWRWFISKKLRESREEYKQVSKLLEAQRDLLKPQAIEDIESCLISLNQESKGAINHESFKEAREELLKTAEQKLIAYPDAQYRDWIEMFLVVATLVLTFRAFFFQPFKIPTGSMQPTLYGITAIDLNKIEPEQLKATVRNGLLNIDGDFFTKNDIGRTIAFKNGNYITKCNIGSEDYPVYSDIFAGETGQTISFDWRALAGSDAYDVFGYIVNTDTNTATVILNQTGADDSGNTSWATANVTIPATGNYRFVFISGSYDYTGGKALGASLYIDNIQVFNAVDDAVVSQVAKLITYETTETTLTEADRSGRTLTFTASDADGNAANNTAVIFENFPKEDAPPPQQLSVANTVAEVVLPSSIIKINRDGLQTFVRDKSAEVAISNQISSDLGGMDAGSSEPTFVPQNNSPKSEPSSSVRPSFNSTNMPLFNSSNPNDGGVSVLNGIENLDIGSLGRISFTIPIDAFAKSNNDTMVSLKASQSGDRALPSWLKFDAVAGKFEGEVPEDFEGSIEVLVTATDQNGNEVTTSFVIEKDISSPATNNEEQSKLSTPEFNKQIIAAQNQAFKLGNFSQQILVSRFSRDPLSDLEIQHAIQEIEMIS